MSQALNQQEREELERLRAEKQKRQEQERAAQERKELEFLRQEALRASQDKLQAENIERARAIMEPGLDMKMPLPQKIVIIFCVCLLFCFIVYLVLT